MKYYIHSTILNLNNILSTESISPPAFYERRGFGNSRFFPIPQNKNRNVLILHPKPFFYELKPDFDGQENYPLIIEVEGSEEFKKFNKPEVDKNDFLIADKTIYLTPYTTRFIFFEEIHKKYAYSSLSLDIETKLLSLYKKVMDVSKPDACLPHIPKIVENEINIDEISKDIRINKIKGIIYAYYAASTFTVSENTLKVLNAYKGLYNICSSIQSNPYKIPSEQQREKILEFYNIIQYEPYISSYEEFKNFYELNNIHPYKMIEKIKCLGSNYKTTTIPGIDELIKYNKCDLINNQTLSTIDNAIKSLDIEMSANKFVFPREQKIQINILDENFISSKIIADESENKLLVDLLNFLVASRKYFDKITNKDLQLADDLTYQAKDSLGDKWVKGFYISDFLNCLRRTINNQENIEDWQDGLLSSIAALTLKGDDWSKLLQFMLGKGMRDCRIAFALYGAIIGYAKLTRDLTDNLLNGDFAAFYRYLHKQLHGIYLPNQQINFTPEVNETSRRHNFSDGHTIYDPISKNVQKNCGYNPVLRSSHGITDSNREISDRPLSSNGSVSSSQNQTSLISSSNKFNDKMVVIHEHSQNDALNCGLFIDDPQAYTIIDNQEIPQDKKAKFLKSLQFIVNKYKDENKRIYKKCKSTNNFEPEDYLRNFSNRCFYKSNPDCLEDNKDNLTYHDKIIRELCAKYKMSFEKWLNVKNDQVYMELKKSIKNFYNKNVSANTNDLFSYTNNNKK